MPKISDYEFASPLPHPGEILREEFMAPLNMTASALGEKMGLNDSSPIEQLVSGAQPITPDTALRLERVFSLDAQYWMNLQAQHDLSKALIEKRSEYRAIEAVTA